MQLIRSRLTSAHLIALLALFVALGGSAYAIHLGKNSVKTRNIKNGAVTESKLRGGAVTAPKLADGAVIGPKLADGAVTGPKLADGAISSAKLAAGAVTGPKLAAGSVGAATVGDIVVRSTSKPIADGGNAIVTATCLSGERLIGGTGIVSTANSPDVVVNGAYPSTADGNGLDPTQSPTGWSVQANNYPGVTTNGVSVIAYALCLK